MPYKLELRYIYGWDDAGWTDEIGNESYPLRFSTIEEAQTELDTFLSEVNDAVAVGNMDRADVRNDYRIVETRENPSK